MAIREIFNHYNETSMSFQSNEQGLNAKDGKMMNLLEFFNGVFLMEVEDMAKSSENAKYVTTPLRGQYLSRIKSNSRSFNQPINTEPNAYRKKY